MSSLALRVSSTLFVGLLAAVLAPSCGGPAERTSPTSAGVAVPEPLGEEAGHVTSAAVEKMLLCHYEEETGSHYDLEVPESAVEAHLGHGDSLGACTTCPCFTVADILALASNCEQGQTLLPSCVLGQSSAKLDLFCSLGDSAIHNFGGFTIDPSPNGGTRCEWYEPDLAPISQAEGLSPEDAQACRDEIAASGYCQ